MKRNINTKAWQVECIRCGTFIGADDSYNRDQDYYRCGNCDHLNFDEYCESTHDFWDGWDQW